jgi:hypothetical protein
VAEFSPQQRQSHFSTPSTKRSTSGHPRTLSLRILSCLLTICSYVSRQQDEREVQAFPYFYNVRTKPAHAYTIIASTHLISTTYLVIHPVRLTSRQASIHVAVEAPSTRLEPRASTIMGEPGIHFFMRVTTSGRERGDRSEHELCADYR